MRPCTLVGRVGATPEMRFTEAGTPVTNFNLALYAGEDKDGNELVTWVRISCWKDLAEVVNARVSKGDQLHIEGYLLPIETFTRKDGTEGQAIKLTAWSVKAMEYSTLDLKPPTETPPEYVKSTKKK